MSMRNLIQDFEDAFREPDKVQAQDYQKVVESNAAKAAENAERLTLRLLSLVALLALVALGEVSKIGFGPGEINNRFVLIAALLVLISYTHYDLVFNLSKFDQLSIIYKIIVKHQHGPIHERGLSKYFLFPPALYEYRFFNMNGRLRGVQAFIWLLQFIVLVFVIPLGAEIIGFSNLWQLQSEGYPFLLLGCLLITAVLNLQSFFILAARYEAQTR